MIFFVKCGDKIFWRKKRMVLTEERKCEIEKIANAKIAAYDLNAPGFDLVSFLSEKESFMVGMQEMEDDTNGLIIINDDNYISGLHTHKLIAVNSNLRQAPNFIQRRRFIVAHEYGHSLLHKKNGKLYAHRDTAKKTAPEEQEAEYFAMCLLMPSELIRAIWKDDEFSQNTENEKIQKMGEIFRVTEKKMRQRLLDLGLRTENV